MLNNTVRYTDPTGNRSCDDFDENGNCLSYSVWGNNKEKSAHLINEHELALTSRGEDQKELYNLFLSTKNGWWQKLIADGANPLLLFISLMLGKETSPLRFSDPDWESVGRVHFHRATAGAFWIWDQLGQGAPRSTTETAILNWLGSFSGSAQKVFQTALTSIGDMDSQYKDLSPSARLEKLLNQQEAFDPQMAGMVADIFFDAPDPAWQRGKMPTWGNDPPSKYPDLQVKYQFGGFYIYGP